MGERKADGIVKVAESRVAEAGVCGRGAMVLGRRRVGFDEGGDGREDGEEDVNDWWSSARVV